MKIQVFADDGSVMFESDDKSMKGIVPATFESAKVAAALAEAAQDISTGRLRSVDRVVIASINADIQAAVARIEAELGAHPAFTWAQTKLSNAIAHLEQYAAGIWTEPPVVQGVTVDDRGVVLAVKPAVAVSIGESGITLTGGTASIGLAAKGDTLTGT